MGLKPEHHKELNYPPGVKAGRYDELRQEYARDPVALQQIDVYDGSTEYHRRLREFVEALKAKNEAKANELETWFKKHYPDIK